MALLDHFSINISNYDRSKAFYEKALAPLGATAVMEYGKACGFGRDGKPDFWSGEGVKSFQKPDDVKVLTQVHVCFAARSRGEVDAFHKAALAAGGKDNGGPGIRKDYHPNYYGRSSWIPTGTTSRRSFIRRDRREAEQPLEIHNQAVRY